MRASKFEFENRFWIISAIYFAAFSLSLIDHTSFIVALRHLIAPSLTPGSAGAERFARIIILLGSLLVFLAAWLRTWGVAYLQTEIAHDTSQHSHALVADGPFRHTRNPLYFSNIPMALGIGVLLSVSGFVFLVLANWIFRYRLIAREEESLLKTQGESGRSVLPGSPAFLARTQAASSRRKWSAALAGGIRRRNFYLDIRGGRIAGRDHATAADSMDRICSGICGEFFD